MQSILYRLQRWNKDNFKQGWRILRCKQIYFKEQTKWFWMINILVKIFNINFQ